MNAGRERDVQEVKSVTSSTWMGECLPLPASPSPLWGPLLISPLVLSPVLEVTVVGPVPHAGSATSPRRRRGSGQEHAPREQAQ